MARQTTEQVRVRLKPLTPVTLALAVVVAVPANLTARESEEPWLALRTGMKCSQCHVNRSGGGGRNDFGNAWAQTALPAGAAAEVRSRALNDWVALGFDLRVFAAAALSDADPRSEVGIQEAQIQLEAKLIANELSFYVDQTLGPGTATPREVFGLWHGLPLNTYVKAGKFMLPYGWRLWDDNAYIRQETGFTYRTPEIGVEVGLEPGPMSLFVALSNGTTASVENDTQKKLTTSGVYVHRYFRVGGSFAYNSDATSRTSTAGVLGGFNVGPLAVLGEVDYVFNRLKDTSSGSSKPPDQFVAYVEGNLLPTRGLNAKVTYGYHDPDRDVAENQRTRMRFGMEWFPIPFVQLAGFYTLVEDVPQVETDVDVVSLEFHVHF